MIIGFTGKMGSGKTTACDMVKQSLANVSHINFKDALIKELRLFFPDVLRAVATDVAGERLGGWQTEPTDVIEDIEMNLFYEKPPVIRALMRNFGTELRRSSDPEYWIKKWKETVTYTDGKHVVTDDVRFVNEAEAVREFGGIVIRIARTDITDTGTHQSESEMDNIVADHTISVGKGELDKLRTELNTIVCV